MVERVAKREELNAELSDAVAVGHFGKKDDELLPKALHTAPDFVEGLRVYAEGQRRHIALVGLNFVDRPLGRVEHLSMVLGDVKAPRLLPG